MTKRRPTQPGEILLEEVIKPLGLTVTEAPIKLRVSRKALSELLNPKAALSTQMALLIARATDTSPESWLSMQTKLDLWGALREEPPNVVHFTMEKVV